MNTSLFTAARAASRQQESIEGRRSEREAGRASPCICRGNLWSAVLLGAVCLLSSRVLLAQALEPIVVPGAAAYAAPVADGTEYTGTESSPSRMVVAKAALDLNRAFNATQSDALRASYARWQAAVRKHGLDSLEAMMVESQYMMQYGQSLDQFIEAVQSILTSLEGLPDEDPDPGAEQSDPLVERGRVLLARSDTRKSWRTGACHLAPEKCQLSSEEEDEIVQLIEERMRQLSGADPQADLSVASVRRKAELYLLYAEMTRKGIGRAGMNLIPKLMPRGPGGKISMPPIPRLQNKKVLTTRSTKGFGDPYRD